MTGVNTKLPIIEQLQNAPGDRQRADLLLRCPDSIVLKYAEPIAAICRRASFEAGELFVHSRVAALLSVRNAAGGLPGKLAMDMEMLRAVLAAFAAGAPLTPPVPDDPGPEWPLDAPQGRHPPPLDI